MGTLDLPLDKSVSTWGEFLFIDLIFLLLNMIYYLTTYLALLYTPLILYTTINLYCLTEKGKKFYAYIVGRSNTKDMFFAIQRYSLCIGTNFTYILFIIFIRNLLALFHTEPHAYFWHLLLRLYQIECQPEYNFI